MAELRGGLPGRARRRTRARHLGRSCARSDRDRDGPAQRASSAAPAGSRQQCSMTASGGAPTAPRRRLRTVQERTTAPPSTRPSRLRARQQSSAWHSFWRALCSSRATAPKRTRKPERLGSRYGRGSLRRVRGVSLRSHRSEARLPVIVLVVADAEVFELGRKCGAECPSTSLAASDAGVSRDLLGGGLTKVRRSTTSPEAAAGAMARFALTPHAPGC